MLVPVIAAAAVVAALHPPVAGLTEWDRVNLERNLRWTLARARAKPTAPVRVGVFADAGVWHPGARSIVDALEADGVPCRVLDQSRLTADSLRRLEAVVIPGGWAPFIRDAAGPLGLAALKRYVEAGGRCLGVCAGAYLLSAEVKYDGVRYPYPVRLFDGTSAGPVPGLAMFPKPGSVTLTVTPAGRNGGLHTLGGRPVYFSGGPCFVGGTGVTVLATYPDGSAAAVARPVGRGEVVLIGAHPERPPEAGDESLPPAAAAGAVYRTLLQLDR